MAHFLTQVIVLAALLLLLLPCDAKFKSGKAHLSGVKTEATLVKFAVSAESTARLDVNITSYG